MGVVEEFNLLLEKFPNFKNFKDIKIEKEEDIKKIPLTIREDLRTFNLADVKEQPAVICFTSGSTGKNVPIFHSKKEDDAIINKMVGALDIMGVKKEDVILNLFSYSITNCGRLFDHAVKRKGCTIIPISVLTDLKRKTLVLEIIKKLKPTVVLSTPNQFCNLLNNLEHKYAIRKCMITGEFLSSKFKTKVKEKGIDLHNMYGCDELGTLAIQEKKDDEFMVLIDEGLYIEVMNENKGTGITGKGDIIVTSLYNFSMPVVRYKIGDKVEIMEKDGKKYIKLLGRSDSYTKIQGEITSKTLLIDKIYDILGHPNFFILLSKDKDYEDDFIINIPKKDFDKRKEIKNTFNKLGIYPKIKTTNIAVPRTHSGKFIHIIDKRKLMLNDKKLNW